MTELQQIRDWIMPLTAIVALLVAIGQAKEKIRELEGKYNDLSQEIHRLTIGMEELKGLVIRAILEKDKGGKT
ncbi:hypothetical protein [Candidatus Methylacidithermus pantelleriae]|uniref:Uncharacterized protein n=1 Tax=Candidatus Methylacidithermus pantelleriae TaxID=2744239 RepID=A0A8J2FT48_9BACT|nr:hypothetical protein [Candidatus Methylacidithermus pantelleriae]CAF0700537.1 hypothetical protein MPNT_380005 [Candidatus Methylacidithermus pantelleriae]